MIWHTDIQWYTDLFRSFFLPSFLFSVLQFGVLFRLSLKDQELQQRYRYDLDQEKASSFRGDDDAGGGEAKDENEGRHISNMMDDPHNGI